MRDLAGWEILLGGALLVFLLWRWRPRSAGTPQTASGEHKRDWPGFIMPILLVILLVLAMIGIVRG